MIDYEILKLIWWLFVGVLLVGFAVMDGQDMGVGTLLPFLGKDDTERRVMINTGRIVSTFPPKNNETIRRYPVCEKT